MAGKKREEEAINWFSQAKYDFKAARWNLEGGFYNTVCFLSQQAAEKALKAIIYYAGLSRKKILTHSVFELLQTSQKILPALTNYLDGARELDLHYIPSRYPNGLVSGYPHQFYGKNTASSALVSAEKIIHAIENYLISQGLLLQFDE